MMMKPVLLLLLAAVALAKLPKINEKLLAAVKTDPLQSVHALVTLLVEDRSSGENKTAAISKLAAIKEEMGKEREAELAKRTSAVLHEAFPVRLNYDGSNSNAGGAIEKKAAERRTMGIIKHLLPKRKDSKDSGIAGLSVEEASLAKALDERLLQLSSATTK